MDITLLLQLVKMKLIPVQLFYCCVTPIYHQLLFNLFCYFTRNHTHQNLHILNIHLHACTVWWWRHGRWCVGERGCVWADEGAVLDRDGWQKNPLRIDPLSLCPLYWTQAVDGCHVHNCLENCMFFVVVFLNRSTS